MTNPVYLNPVLQNADTILEKCVEIYQTLSVQQQVNSRFVDEEVTWLTTTNMVAHITLGSGQQVEIPSWSYVSSIATASTQLTQSLQQELVTIFTSTNPTVTIDDGFGNQIQIPSYNALDVRSATALTNANTAYGLAGTANTAAQSALTLATAANTLAQVGVNNSNPPNYPTLVELNQATDRPLNSIAYVVNDQLVDNNTIYQWAGASWVKIYDRLRVALGDTRGYQANFPNAVRRTYFDKVDVLINPEDAGAKGNNIDDDGPAFTAAAASGRVLVLLPGKSYKIATNATVGSIIPNGATIEVAASTTLTYGTVVGDEATPVFFGDGSAVSASGYYSVGWYGGNSFNEKWDAVRRGFTPNARKYVLVPVPHPSDPAADATDPDTIVRWKVTGNILLEQNESNTTFDADGGFIVPNGATVSIGMFTFGNTTTTSNVTFTNGLDLRVNSNAPAGISFRSGSAIHFAESVSINGATSSCIDWSGYSGPTSNITFERLEVSAFGIGGISCIMAAGPGITPALPLLKACRISTLITKGGRTGSRYLLYTKGNVNGLRIDTILEDRNTSGLLSDWSDAMLIVGNVAQNQDVGTAFGTGVVIGSVKASTTRQAILRTEDNVGGATAPIVVSIGSIDQGYRTNIIPVLLTAVNNASVGRVNSGSPTADQPVLCRVSPDSGNVSFNGTHYSAVRSQAPRVQFDGRYGMVDTLPTNTASWVAIPNGFTTQKFDVISLTQTLEYATGWASTENLVIPPAMSSAGFYKASGVLNGTTGPDGSVNISAAESKFFVENRTGETQLIATMFV